VFSRIPYRYKVLALLIILSVAGAYFGRGYWAVDAFAANVAAGFMGALLTVVLVDRAAERRQEETRQRVQRIACHERGAL
jgi:membrane associated rhomboid family serine protease